VPNREEQPLARSSDLIVEELGEEVLVYDTKTDRAHSLSPEASKVWRACDGSMSAQAMSARLGLESAIVDRALEELSGCQLLEVSRTVVADGSTRREVTLKLAKAGAAVAAAPLILSVTAPPAWAAVSAGFCAGLITSNNCGCGTGSGGCCASVGCCCCVPGGSGAKQCVPIGQEDLCTAGKGCSSGTTTTTLSVPSTSSGLGSAVGPQGGIGSGIGH
jgi:DNA-binding MarR family transcriptional regulator